MNLSEKIHKLMGCRSLKTLMETAMGMLENPLILADLTFHVLSISEKGNIEDPRWLQIHGEQSLPMNIVNIGLYQTALQKGRPVVNKDSTGLTIVRCGVAQENRLLGYLLSPCYLKEPSQDDLELMGLLSDLCALKMQKELHYAQYPEDMLAFFLSNLLNGTLRDEQKIQDRCRYFGWGMKPPYRVLTVEFQNNRGLEAGQDYLALEQKKAALQQRFPEATTFFYGNQLKMIIHVHDQTTQDAIVMGEVGAFLEEHHMVAGVSQIAYQLSKISGRHQQALKALQMGLLFQGNGPLFHYDTYSIYHCLELCSSQIDLLQLCHTAAKKLESYDRKNGTELMGTLHAYLACHQNRNEAAERLYIHRNTLAKRLEKINDLISVDFSDPETAFHLMFSFRVLEYYGATQRPDSYEDWMEKSPNLRHP